MSFTLVITLVLPLIVLTVYAFLNKGKKVLSAWFLGAAGFVVFQMMLRTPILSYVSTLPGFETLISKHYILYAIILGVSAALFEVAARLSVAVIMSDRLTFQRGMAAGLGHGGIEAMLVVGLTYANNMLYTGMINDGTYDTLIQEGLAAGMDVTSLYEVKDALLNTPFYLFGLSGFERLLTMTCHLAMSLAICYFVSKKQPVKGALIVFAFHALIDTGSGILSGLSTPYMGEPVSEGVGYVLTYGFLIVMTAVAVWAILKLKEHWESEEVAA